MTNREKLIEMLKTIYKEYSVSPSDDLIANYLISNGVVVREKGEWIPVEPFGNVWRCTACGEDYDMEDDAIPMTWGINFCPSCGADMRGEQHDD